MKIVLNDVKHGMELGSSRLYIHNVHHWFQQLGYDSHINDFSQYKHYDVAIFGKDMEFTYLQEAKQQNPRLVCGRIHPTDLTENGRRYLEDSNFIMVGSITEKEYFSEYGKPTFYFPQIERLFTRIKKHTDHEPIHIGYHGNLDHLTHFSAELIEALEILGRETAIKFIAIYNITGLGTWRHNRPGIDIEDVQWNLLDLEKQLLRCDIGLVPGLTTFKPWQKQLFFKLLKTLNRKQRYFPSDYLIRFKQNTNAGRAFVFHQLGIPVVSDFMPTSFHILTDPRCGYLASSKDGWLQAFRELCSSAEKRRTVADCALKEFNRLYDPLDWAERYYRFLECLVKQRREEAAGDPDN